MSGVTNSASSHPAYTTILPKSAATIARILRDNGYNTAMVGKAHITPKWETGPTGPFDRWPTGLGFEYFYGLLDGDTDQDRKSVVSGKGVSGRVDLGGRRNIKKKNKRNS